MADKGTRVMTASEAESNFRGVVERVTRNGERVAVQDRGATIVGVVSADDLRRLDQCDQEREADFAILDRLGAAFADVPDEEIEREVDRALAAHRARKRAAGR